MMALSYGLQWQNFDRWICVLLLTGLQWEPVVICVDSFLPMFGFPKSTGYKISQLVGEMDGIVRMGLKPTN